MRSTGYATFIYSKLLTVLILSIFIGLCSPLSAQFLSGIIPKYGASLQTSTVNFSWNSFPGAQNYQVKLTQDPNFTQNVLQSGQVTSTNWLSPALGYGNWYWKVEATTNQGLVVGETEFFVRFDPSQQANLSLWLKADAGVSLDGSSLVQTWTDQSSAALQFTQASTSKRPTVTASSFGGFPSLLFTGGTKVLSGGDVLDLGLNSRAFYVVGKMAATNQTFFSKTIAALAATRYGIIKDGSSTAFICQTTSSAQHHVYSAINSVNFGLYNAQLNRGASQARFSLNGTLLGTSSVPASYDWNSTYRFLIGAYNNATDNGELLPLNGNISEMVFVDTEDANERLKIENYLKYKYHNFDAGADVYNAGFCNTTLTLPSGFSNISWSNGATTISVVLSNSENLTVQANDPLGFLWTDTILVTYPTIPSPMNTGICAGQSNTWNADMGAGFTYLWSNGATSPSLTITTPGQYFVKVTDQFGCFKFSDTLDFTLDTYSITANLGADTNLCSGNFIALQSGAGETVSYLWPDGSNGNQYAVDTTGNYYVQSVNVNGCVAQDTVHINVIGIAPLAEFSTANVCDGITANFTDNSVPVGVSPIDAWAWDFGDDSLSTNQSPSHAYSVPGTYIVELFVSQGGCGAFHYDTVTVHENPEALFVFSGYCQNQPVQFNNATIVGDAPLTTYAWNFDMPWTGAYNVSTIPIPYREFDSSGVFDVQLTVTDANGCVDEVIIPVNIDPSPEVTFAISDACVNQTAAIQFTGTTQGPSTYAWDFGDNGSSILMNPTHTYSVYGNYTVSLAVTNQYNCTLTGQNQVEVFATPIPSFDLGPYCKGTYVEMTNTSTIADGSIAQTSWVINATDTVNGNPGFYLIDNLGQQQIEVISTSNDGCSASTFEFIEVEDSLNVSFTVGTGIAAVGEPFPFTNTTTGTNLALWNFGDQTFSSEFSPVHTYGEAYTDSVVEVYLIGLNAAGCVDTAYQNVTVRPAELDLAIETLFLQENGTFDFLGVKMKNEGTVSVKKVEFDVFSDKGPLFQETWTGNLLPTKDSIYVFLSQPSLNFSTEDDKQAYVCVKSIAYDWQNEAETILDNNDRCLNLEGDGVILTTIAPNPASTEVGFQLLVTKSSTISAELIDMNGKMAKILIPSTTVEPGIVNINADIRQLENGVYFLKFTSNGSTTTQRLVILQ
jgi:PKD repeat protein